MIMKTFYTMNFSKDELLEILTKMDEIYNSDYVSCTSDIVCDKLYEQGFDIEINLYQFLDYCYYACGWNIEHEMFLSKNLENVFAINFLKFLQEHYPICLDLDNNDELSWIEHIDNYFKNLNF